MMCFRKIGICLIYLILMVVQIRAQDTTIEIGSIIESSLSANQTETFRLSALETSLISFHVEALNETLDPAIRILDNAGNVIIMNDDYNYPDTHDALIQAFVIPRTDTYTVEVSAFGNTSGDYRLSVLPGYDSLAFADTAPEKANWQPTNSDLMSTTDGDNGLRVDIEGIAVTSNLLATQFPKNTDYYYEAKFRDISATSSWQVGIVFRHINPTLFYRLIMNDQGFWQLEWINGDEITVIHSWSTHPAIVPGTPNFTLGILISGQSIDIVYNQYFIGTVYDDHILQPGNVGVTAITANAVASRVSFGIDEATVTIPTTVNNKPIFPEFLVANNYSALAHILERQQVIPIGGEAKLTVSQIAIRNIDPGVSRFPIASGVDFTQFVMGGTLSWETLTEGIGGCGITFNDEDNNHYTLAYINSAGEYGVSRRDGDAFAQGIYGENLAPDRPHNIIVVVTSDTIYYYIDYHHIGTMSYTPTIGELSAAVVNFHGVDTNCTFENIWLWSLDNASS